MPSITHAIAGAAMLVSTSACVLESEHDGYNETGISPFEEVGASEAPFDSQGRLEVGMSLRGFDAAVARAHGFEIVTLPDGATASVPVEKAEAARSGEYRPTEGTIPAEGPRDQSTLRGYGELPGECGVSYVELAPIGFSKAHLITGFEITASGAVWDMNWNVRIHDNGGDSTQHYEMENGFPVGNGWQSYFRVLGLTVGWADATVEWYTSWAILTNGWLCYSMGPVAVDWIY